MLIVGAGGFAKQLIQVFEQLNKLDELVLFDDYTLPKSETLFGIPILHSEEEVKHRFQTINNQFILGIGNPQKRYQLAKKFKELGGEIEGLISPLATISKIETKIGKGVTILTNVIIETGVEIGEGALINIGTYITHNCVIGNYTEISPGVRISGDCSIGSFCFLGTGCILVPKVTVGNETVIAAGCVVTTNLPAKVLVAGVPGRIKKKL
jgi:sugar O-acyltransferase (sialic acid O-acetyltransferase NeuD family)